MNHSKLTHTLKDGRIIVYISLISGIALIIYFIIRTLEPRESRPSPVDNSLSDSNHRTIDASKEQRLAEMPDYHTVPFDSSERVPPSNVRRHIVLPPSVRLTSELSNKGRETALNAAETFIWAALNQSRDTMAEMIAITFVGTGVVSSAYLKEKFDGLPEHLRKEVKSWEELLALMYENELEPYGAFELVESRSLAPTVNEFTYSFYDADGRKRQEVLLMKQTNTGWKRLQYLATVRKLADTLQKDQNK